MIDVKTLSIKEKVSLLNKLYKDISGLGIGGDTELAHVNPWEADLLRSVGGAGTVNEVTGLPQYLGGGSKPAPQPDTTTTKNVPEYAPEQREYITDIFGKSQELYEQRMEEGYDGGPDARMAAFDPRETEAFTGMANLARGPGAAPAYETARLAALGAASPITAGEIQQGMNPYQQAVTDIGKREAVRDYQRGPLAQLRTGAVESGGLRGARRFIEEGEGQRNLNQQLADMQMTGSNQAFKQSMAEAAASRGRLANLATQMPTIGTGAYNQQMGQYGQLGGVGEAYRDREQSGINLAQQKFLQEEAFPEEQLGRYLRFITNAPSPSGFSQTVQAPGVRGPSALTQATGLMGGLGALAGGFGGRSGFNQGGRVDTRRGGVPTGRQAGLSGVVRRAGGGQIVRMQEGGPPPRTSLGRDMEGLKEWFDRSFVNIPGAEERRLAEKERMDNSPLNQAYDYFFEPEGTAAITKARREGVPGGISVDTGGQAQPDLYADPNMELVAGLKEDEIKKLLPPATPEATVVEETVVTEQPTPERSRETLVDQFKKLMEVPEAEMSWAERLQLASTLMNAGNKGSTGSFLGDLSQFGADTAGGVGKALSSRDARALAAQKRKIKTLKDFNQFAKDAQLTPIEIEQAKLDLGLARAKTRKLGAEADDLKSKKYEYDVPETGLIREAETALKNVGTFNYDKTSFDKNTVKTPGTLGYDIAALAKMTGQSPRDLVAILNAKGLIITNNKGKHVLNREVFSDAESKVVQSRAEGGLVGDDRPILRYPEDF